MQKALRAAQSLEAIGSERPSWRWPLQLNNVPSRFFGTLEKLLWTIIAIHRGEIHARAATLA